MGFEPTREFYPPTRFPGVHLRPLGHLSSIALFPQQNSNIKVYNVQKYFDPFTENSESKFNSIVE